MAKKKKSKPKFRNRAPVAALPRARVVRAKADAGTASTAEEEHLERLLYTAAGAAGTAVVGGFLARQNWQPKTIASVLTAVGGAVAWAGKTDRLQSIGAGTLAAGGGQLALLLLDDNDRSQKEPSKPVPEKKPANSYALPAGALESAFERARAHMSITDDYADEAA